MSRRIGRGGACSCALFTFFGRTTLACTHPDDSRFVAASKLFSLKTAKKCLSCGCSARQVFCRLHLDSIRCGPDTFERVSGGGQGGSVFGHWLRTSGSRSSPISSRGVRYQHQPFRRQYVQHFAKKPRETPRGVGTTHRHRIETTYRFVHGGRASGGTRDVAKLESAQDVCLV